VDQTLPNWKSATCSAWRTPQAYDALPSLFGGQYYDRGQVQRGRVRLGQLCLQKCSQAHDHIPDVLPHMNLYVSKTRLWDMKSLITVKRTRIFPKRTRYTKWVQVCETRGKISKVRILVSCDTEDIAVKLHMNPEVCAIETLPVEAAPGTRP